MAESTTANVFAEKRCQNLNEIRSSVFGRFGACLQMLSQLCDTWQKAEKVSKEEKYAKEIAEGYSFQAA